jgi:hypothetical protein
MTKNNKIKENTMTRFEETLSNYVYYIQNLLNKYYVEAKLTNLTVSKIEVNKGRRFMKVIRSEVDGSSKSVHSFVEIETGNIYKAASWKQPELNHVRANIYNYDSLVNGVNWCGANYLR